MPKKIHTPPSNLLIVPDANQVPEGARVIFQPYEGPQTEAYLSRCHMVLYGGARGGGKSHISRGKTIAGSPDGGSQPHELSYVFHPGYRALVLRRNYKDLLDYKDRAAQLYAHLGGRWKESGSYFEFPPYDPQPCAKIVLGHLADEESYGMYLGQEYQRIFIEEVTQIKSKLLFQRVIGSCRSSFKELKTQIFLTANPEGPGFHWVKEMFFTHPVTGKKVPPKTPIVEEFVDPVTGKVLTLDRVFIPAKVWDNKHILEHDPQYVALLMGLPEPLRRAYLDGDWDAISGSTFFTEFRKNGPREGEPEWANHCVDSSEVWHMPWHRMWCGLDWAYGHYSVCYWFFESDEDHRVNVCDELRVTGMGSYDLGIEVGRRMLPYLSDSRKHIPIYMSPDAWQRRDSSPGSEDLSIVNRFQKGLQYVLGTNAVYVPTPEDMEGALNERLDLRTRARIVVLKAPNHRISGWQHCREMLNWKPQLTGTDFDDRGYLQSILEKDNCQELYAQWIKAKQAANTKQVLPRMRIFRDKCPFLIKGIESAVFDEDKQDVLKVDADPQLGKPGDDEIDAWRYGCSGWLREKQILPPLSDRWLMKVREVAHMDYNDQQLAQIRHQLYLKELARERQSHVPVLIPRRSSHWKDCKPGPTRLN